MTVRRKVRRSKDSKRKTEDIWPVMLHGLPDDEKMDFDRRESAKMESGIGKRRRTRGKVR